LVRHIYKNSLKAFSYSWLKVKNQEQNLYTRGKN